MAGLIMAVVWLDLLLRAVSAPQVPYVLVPVRVSANVTAVEAQVFYQGIVKALGARAGIQIIERSELPRILKEQDAALALASATLQTPAPPAASTSPKQEILAPEICQLENDYFLTLRRLNVQDGRTRCFAIRKARLTARFDATADALVQEVLDEKAADKPGPIPAQSGQVTIEEIRGRCRKTKADRLFPALWDRTERLYRESPRHDSSVLIYYYTVLLRLSLRAGTPPAGMVFVPGGWVRVRTAGGERPVWVEPFFIDRREVSVEEFAQFLEQLAAQNPDQAKDFAPITASDPQFNRPGLPVTGITWTAANAYAQWRHNRLPTCLQWQRAAAGDQNWLYPCGKKSDLARCNLDGELDGFLVLAPVEGPGEDESAFCVLGMTGNAREWTATWFSPDLYARSRSDRAEEPLDGTLKIVKGGGWRSGEETARCSHNDAVKPGEAFDDIGFRCAKLFFEENGL